MPSDDETTISELAARLGAMSRSERARELFDFDPWSYQAEVLDAPDADRFTDGRVRVTFVGGRSIGKSRTAGLIPADRVLMHPGEDVLIAARYAETATELFRETRRHLSNTGLTDEQLGIERATRTTIETVRGARVMARTLSHDGRQQRGKHPSCIVIDEAALLDAAVFDEVLDPMLAAHDEFEVYLISTPRSTGSYLHRKHTVDDGWLSVHAPSSASPLIDDEFLDRKRDETTSTVFAREYEGRFVSADGSYLPYDLVAPRVSADESLDRAPGARAYLGVDVARSGTDRSAYVAIDERGTVFDVQTVDTERTTEAVGRIRALDQEHGFDRIYVDESAVGGGVVDFGAESLSNVVGVPFSTKRKSRLYQGLKKAFEDSELSLPNHRDLIDELTGLDYSFTSSGLLKVHARSGRDDLADATALAVAGMHGGACVGSHRNDRPTPVYSSSRSRSRESSCHSRRESRRPATVLTR